MGMGKESVEVWWYQFGTEGRSGMAGSGEGFLYRFPGIVSPVDSAGSDGLQWIWVGKTARDWIREGFTGELEIEPKAGNGAREYG